MKRQQISTTQENKTIKSNHKIIDFLLGIVSCNFSEVPVHKNFFKLTKLIVCASERLCSEVPDFFFPFYLFYVGE